MDSAGPVSCAFFIVHSSSQSSGALSPAPTPLSPAPPALRPPPTPRTFDTPRPRRVASETHDRPRPPRASPSCPSRTLRPRCAQTVIRPHTSTHTQPRRTGGGFFFCGAGGGVYEGAGRGCGPVSEGRDQREPPGRRHVRGGARAHPPHRPLP